MKNYFVFTSFSNLWGSLMSELATAKEVAKDYLSREQHIASDSDVISIKDGEEIVSFNIKALLAETVAPDPVVEEVVVSSMKKSAKVETVVETPVDTSLKDSEEETPPVEA